MKQNSRYYKLCLFCFLMILFCSVTAFGATIHVPGEYQKIQPAIDASSNGDIILVADGTYKGSGNKDLDFKGKAITLQSENGPGKCIIDGEKDGRGFYFHSGEGQGSVVTGFTITNCYAYNYYYGGKGGGIFCDNSSSPTINNCIINFNKADADGGGIYCNNSSSPSITNCAISYNEAGLGGGITCDNSSSPSIINCTINNNRGHGIFCNEFSSLIIADCTIVNNSGHGIICTRNRSSPLLIRNCTISNNSGFGVYSEGYYSPSISKCTISKNNMGGISITGAYTGIITNCLIIVNTSSGIYSLGSTLIITNCTIAKNTNGGLYCDGTSIWPTIINSIVWENSPKEILIGQPTIVYSDIQGGSPGIGNIDANPLFVSTDDYHLTGTSPCIDGGSSKTETEVPNADIEGNPRPQGSDYDMGAYEYSGLVIPDPQPPIAESGPDKIIVLDRVTLDGSQSYDLDSQIISYQWRLQHRENSAYNRTAEGEKPTIFNLEPGFYDVFLTVIDDSGRNHTDSMLLAVGGQWDMNGDNKFGLEEIIYGLQILTGIRPQN